MMAKIFFIIFLIAVLIIFVIMASSVIAILFHICGEDLEHQNSVNVLSDLADAGVEFRHLKLP